MRKILFIVGLAVIVGCHSGNRSYSNDRGNREDSVTTDTSVTISKADFEKLRDSLNLDSSCIYVPSKGKDIKALFYMINSTKDTFYYTINKDNSITRIAIFYKGGGVNEREYTYTNNEIRKR